MTRERLVDLAARYGVSHDYLDQRANRREVNEATLIAVLAALDVDAADDDAVDAAFIEADIAPWRSVLPPVFVLRQDNVVRVLVHVPHGDPVRLWVTYEDGARGPTLIQVGHDVEPRVVDDVVTGEAAFEIPAGLTLGWHVLHASVGHADVGAERESSRTTLVVTPTRLDWPCGDPRQRRRGWAVQLYSVRSSKSWGVGDAADLADLAVWAASGGADFVLVNPMHAGWPTLPMEPSPYLPTSRRFGDPLYIRIEAIEEMTAAGTAARAYVAHAGRVASSANRIAEFIDRDRCWELKLPVLRMVSSLPRSADREAAFVAYREREGQGLEDFAVWCALVTEHGRPTTWPDELADARSTAVSAEATRLADSVRFFQWCQWILAQQLEGAHRVARDAGLALGVMHDVAVGVHPQGGDVWADAGVFARGVSVGAPPDMYNQQGQNWSQPPWRPDRLAQVAFAPYRDMLRTVLRHAGAIRVDHVLGLFRLWWIPAGMGAGEGTYVRCDHEALIGILALEAQRAGAVVIGEDLGTVEPWVQDVLRDRGILGTSILWFERQDGHIAPPEHWRADVIASVTTHDLPPTRGYLEGTHIDLRARFGLLSEPVEHAWAEHRLELADWQRLLVDRGLLGAEVGPTDDPGAWVTALHQFLQFSPARLLAASLVDAVGDHVAQNQPGTHQEYPNWQAPLRRSDGAVVLIDDLAVLIDAVAAARLLGSAHASDDA